MTGRCQGGWVTRSGKAHALANHRREIDRTVSGKTERNERVGMRGGDQSCEVSAAGAITRPSVSYQTWYARAASVASGVTIARNDRQSGHAGPCEQRCPAYGLFD